MNPKISAADQDHEEHRVGRALSISPRRTLPGERARASANTTALPRNPTPSLREYSG